jgi:hypothetical protein
MDKNNLYSGISFFVIGIIFGVSSLSYEIGTINDMGPGFYPLMISLVLIFLSLILILKK